MGAAILKTANAASPNAADLLPAAAALFPLAADCQLTQRRSTEISCYNSGSGCAD